MIDLIHKTDASEAEARRRRAIRKSLKKFSFPKKTTCFDGQPGISAKAVAEENEKERNQFRIHF